MAQCLIHRTGSLFKAFINVTGTPNSNVTATLEDKVFTGVTNSSGVATIIVKKKGTYRITSNASGSQTKSVDVLERNQTYSVNISGQFSITITYENSSVSVTRNSSPYAKASVGSLGSGAIIYYGDTFTVTGTANDGFDSWKKTVTGATASGNIYTVTGDVTVSTTASAIIYMLLFNEGIGTNISAERISVGAPGTYAGATTGTLEHNSTIYKGDVLKFTASATEDAYNTPEIDLANPENYTVTGDTTVEATTTVKSFTLTINTTTGNTIAANRKSSPYKGAAPGSLNTLATIYYGDTIQFSQSVSTYYTGNYTVKNGASTDISGSTSEKIITVKGNVVATPSATRNKVTFYMQYSYTSKKGSQKIVHITGTGYQGYTLGEMATSSASTWTCTKWKWTGDEPYDITKPFALTASVNKDQAGLTFYSPTYKETILSNFYNWATGTGNKFNKDTVPTNGAGYWYSKDNDST